MLTNYSECRLTGVIPSNIQPNSKDLEWDYNTCVRRAAFEPRLSNTPRRPAFRNTKPINELKWFYMFISFLGCSAEEMARMMNLYTPPFINPLHKHHIAQYRTDITKGLYTQRGNTFYGGVISKTH